MISLNNLLLILIPLVRCETGEKQSHCFHRTPVLLVVVVRVGD